MKTQQQRALRIYIRSRKDFQDLKNKVNNRLGKKSDGKDQDLQDGRSFAAEDIDNFVSISQWASEAEKGTDKMLKRVLKQVPVYNEWLSQIKGVGPASAGWIISEFDIEEATTVSKMWQYAGMNPDYVCGKIRVNKDSYKTGKILYEVANQRTGGKDYIVETEDKIRGDRPTPGYLLPYNKNLKTHLLGVLGEGFIKQRSSYALEYYYPYKERLAGSDSLVKEVKKGGKAVEVPWKEAAVAHRHHAAIRYMMKMFLKDLYVAWRTIEGLPVEERYQDKVFVEST
jgi:hypothetical protein